MREGKSVCIIDCDKGNSKNSDENCKAAMTFRRNALAAIKTTALTTGFCAAGTIVPGIGNAAGAFFGFVAGVTWGVVGSIKDSDKCVEC